MSTQQEQLNPATSRRGLIKGALTTGLAIAGAGLLSSSFSTKNIAFADSATSDGLSVDERVHNIASVARTAEQLAVTIYTNGVANATVMGVESDDLQYLKAAAIEEQLHQNLLASLGATALASTFSMPSGAKTFTDLPTFIATLDQVENVFIAAYIAAVREFSILGLPEFARIACQIATIEAQHRALAREIGGFEVPNNWGYAPCPIQTVEDGPKVLAGEGYLSPTSGNSFTYVPVDFTSSTYKGIYARVQYKEPFYAGPPTGRP